MFFTRYADENTTLPERRFISAVFLIAIKGTKMLAVENERGWDIPGGHLEGKETPHEGLVREIMEEGGATFLNEKLFAIIESDNQDKYKDTIMLIYISNNFKLDKFTPSEDAFSREVIEVEEFRERYYQDPKGLDLREIVSKAQKELER